MKGHLMFMEMDKGAMSLEMLKRSGLSSDVGPSGPLVPFPWQTYRSPSLVIVDGCISHWSARKLWHFIGGELVRMDRFSGHHEKGCLAEQKISNSRKEALK